MVACCNNPNIEDFVEPLNSRDILSTSYAVYLGESYYIRKCSSCGAVVSTDYMSNGVNYDFDTCKRKAYTFRKGANIKRPFEGDE